MCKPKRLYVCHLHVGVQKPEQSVRLPGAEVTGSCESLNMGAETIPGSFYKSSKGS